MGWRSATFITLFQSFMGIPGWAQDHPEPEEGVLAASQSRWDYGKRLRDVLLNDAPSVYVARIVCLPSFELEWQVTVLREVSDKPKVPDSHYVEFVGAERRLYRLPVGESVTVRRFRVPLDAETANELNKTWRRMLRRTRYPDEPRLGADGVLYHFGRRLPLISHGDDDPLGGWEQGVIWTPDERSLCGRMVDIGERLRRFPHGRPEERDKIRAEISAALKTLAGELDHNK